MRPQERLFEPIPPAPVRRLRLYHRMVIQCPAKARAADTGFELSELPDLVSGGHWLLDCPECGQDHYWELDDVIIE